MRVVKKPADLPYHRVAIILWGYRQFKAVQNTHRVLISKPLLLQNTERVFIRKRDLYSFMPHDCQFSGNIAKKEMNMHPIRHNWQLHEITYIFEQVFTELIYQAQSVHRKYHDTNQMQLSTLLNIKTGACPEDCAYCSQSIHHNTGLKGTNMLDKDMIIDAARKAKQAGAQRFCMGGAWRKVPREKLFLQLLDAIKAVKTLGLETCLTVGMLTDAEAQRLKQAGLDYYNHNLDTSPSYYKKIISTRTYQDRLNTLKHIRQANLKTCCGGIIGMGESRVDRLCLLQQLANLPQHPESVPVNKFVKVAGTPLADSGVDCSISSFEIVRTIATTRILMPKSTIRLSAGRNEMSNELQALCFIAGARSIFYGDKLLTTNNPEHCKDTKMLNQMRFSTNEKYVDLPSRA